MRLKALQAFNTWMKNGDNFLSGQTIAQLRFEYPCFLECKCECIVLLIVDCIMF